MGLRDKIFQTVFKKQLADLKKIVGSEMYNRILQQIGGTPVYMADDTSVYVNDGYLFNPTVYAVVSFIAQKAGSIPWGVYEIKDEKSLRLYKSIGEVGYKKSRMRKKAMVEVEGHELESLFKRPNPLQSWSEFVEQCVGFKLVTGNSYIHCIGPTGGMNAGLIKEMWNLPSQAIVIIPGNKIQPVAGYKYLPDQSLTIPPEEVIHLKYWTPEYEGGAFLYGLSPIRAGRRVVSKSNSSYDSSVASFQNMGAYGMITGDTGETPLTEEQAEMLNRRWSKLTGPNNAGKPIITSANIKWQQIGMSPVDMNIIESDKMDLRTICNLFHVPSELFNDASNKTYSNTKEAGSAVYTNAVIPALTQMRDGINAYLYARYGDRYFIDFDTSMVSELQEDLQSLSASLASCYWLTGNEKREVLGFGEDEENPIMEEYLIPQGLFPASVTDVSDEDMNDIEKRLNINDYK